MALGTDVAVAETFLAKQTAWVAANPRKTILLWLTSLVAARFL
jgi:hypothetical protein